MRAYRGESGEVLWHDPLATGPAMIRGNMVLKESSAADLITGQPLKRIQDDTERDYIMNADQGKEYGIIDDVIRKRA